MLGATNLLLPPDVRVLSDPDVEWGHLHELVVLDVLQAAAKRHRHQRCGTGMYPRGCACHNSLPRRCEVSNMRQPSKRADQAQVHRDCWCRGAYNIMGLRVDVHTSSRLGSVQTLEPVYKTTQSRLPAHQPPCAHQPQVGTVLSDVELQPRVGTTAVQGGHASVVETHVLHAVKHGGVLTSHARIRNEGKIVLLEGRRTSRRGTCPACRRARRCCPCRTRAC